MQISDCPTLGLSEPYTMRAFGRNNTFFNESEMALFSECILQCAEPPTFSETPDYDNQLG
jgi:hypothetical protein